MTVLRKVLDDGSALDDQAIVDAFYRLGSCNKVSKDLRTSATRVREVLDRHVINWRGQVENNFIQTVELQEKDARYVAKCVKAGGFPRYPMAELSLVQGALNAQRYVNRAKFGVRR